MKVLTKINQTRVMPNIQSINQSSVGDGTEITDVDENEFIDASRLVYDGIRDIRCAVLTNQNPDAFFDLEEEDDKGSFISK